MRYQRKPDKLVLSHPKGGTLLRELTALEYRQILDKIRNMLGNVSPTTSVLDETLQRIVDNYRSTGNLDSCVETEIYRLKEHPEFLNDNPESDPYSAWEARFELGRLYVAALPLLSNEERQIYRALLSGTLEIDLQNHTITGLIAKLRITYVAATTPPSNVIVLDEYRRKKSREVEKLQDAGIHRIGNRATC